MDEVRIGYDAKRAFRNNSGLGNYSRMVIGGVAREGLDCLLYTPSARGRHEHYFDALPSVSVAVPRGLWRLLPDLWRMAWTGHRATSDGISLFHGLSHELPFCINRRVKRVVTMHDLIVRRYPQFFKPADRLIHRLKMRHACRVADIVVAISEQTKRDLMDFMHIPEAKIRVVYQSCDPIFWQWIARPDKQQAIDEVRRKYALPERYIICVGTLEDRKNQKRVVEACRRLPEDVGLLVVGRPRGTYGREVVALQDSRLRVLTDASFADFPALYAGAVASVYMSVFEGFGIPVLESLCCDTPVVTSNLSSMPEAGGDAALYASPEDSNGVAAHLCHLLEDADFRTSMVEKGCLQRQKFAPEKVSKEMVALYRSLLNA